MSEFETYHPVLGLDPGVRGGVAVLRPDRSIAVVHAFRPDMTEQELFSLVRSCARLLKQMTGEDAFLEQVGYMKGDGGLGAFTFGKVYGIAKAALWAGEVHVRDVSPMTWQAKMGCLSGGNKNVTKEKARAIFPKQKITHAIADALLIARYGQERLSF